MIPYLKTLSNKIIPQSEFEIRIGHINPKDRKFSSSISRQQFDAIKNILEQKKSEGLYDIKKTKSTVYNYNINGKNYRMRKIINKTTNEQREIWQEKIKVSNYDECFPTHTCLRFSLSEENGLKNAPAGYENVKPFIRERKRDEYFSVDENQRPFMYSLSQVTQDQKIIYEFEIEFKMDQNRDFDSLMKNIIESIQLIESVLNINLKPIDDHKDHKENKDHKDHKERLIPSKNLELYFEKKNSDELYALKPSKDQIVIVNLGKIIKQFEKRQFQPMNEDFYRKLVYFLKENGFSPKSCKISLNFENQRDRRIIQYGVGKNIIEICDQQRKRIEYPDFGIEWSVCEIKPYSIGQEKMPWRDAEEWVGKKDENVSILINKDKDRDFYRIQLRFTYGNHPMNEQIKQFLMFLYPVLIKNVSSGTVMSYIPITETEYISELLRKTIRSKEQKPINLQRNDIPDLLEDYSVTNKLDGERFRLFFTRQGLYAINSRKVEKLDELEYETFIVMESEFFENKFYIFDLLYDRISTANQTLQERLEKIDHLLKKEDYKNYHLQSILTVKTFYFENIAEHVKELLTNLPRKDNDGIIFTPKGSIGSGQIYKWKFPEKMTIDFKVFLVGKNENNYIYDLAVGKNDGMYRIFDGIKNCKPLRSQYESNVPLQDGGIYEFGFENDHFTLFRFREDKRDPNFETTADSVWKDICNPFTEKELIDLLENSVSQSSLSKEFRSLHNQIKRDLISYYCPHKTVFDMGSGRGGDLGKYEKAQIDFLWAIDPSKDNMEEFRRRLSEKPITFQEKVVTKQTEAQNAEIVDWVRQTNVKRFVTEKVQKDRENWRDWFPIDKNVNRDLLQINKEGEYSITNRYDSDIIMEAILPVMDYSVSSLTLVDGTGNMGGDTIQFAKYFRRVHSIEINEENYKILQNNTQLYGYSNITTQLGDTLELWEKDKLYKTTDVLYLDPPWGGKAYREKEKIELLMGNKNIIEVLDEWKKKEYFPRRYLILKVPSNASVLDVLYQYDAQLFLIRNNFYIVVINTITHKNPYPYWKTADIVSSFFSLSFFFERNQENEYPELNKLVDNIKKITSPGGYFIGTTIDGERLEELLDSQTDKIFTFGKTASYQYSNKEKGEIKLDQPGTIVDEQTEWLVDFPALQDKMDNNTYDRFFDHPVMSILYDTISSLDEKEKELNRLYRQFSFEMPYWFVFYVKENELWACKPNRSNERVLFDKKREYTIINKENKKGICFVSYRKGSFEFVVEDTYDNYSVFLYENMKEVREMSIYEARLRFKNC